MGSWFDLSLQGSWSPLVIEVGVFHDLAITAITAILAGLVVVFIDVLLVETTTISVKDQVQVEVWWTLVPAVVLVLIALPSLQLLYLMDEIETPQISLSVIGHQWF